MILTCNVKSHSPYVLDTSIHASSKVPSFLIIREGRLKTVKVYILRCNLHCSENFNSCSAICQIVYTYSIQYNSGYNRVYLLFLRRRRRLCRRQDLNRRRRRRPPTVGASWVAVMVSSLSRWDSGMYKGREESPVGWGGVGSAPLLRRSSTGDARLRKLKMERLKSVCFGYERFIPTCFYITEVICEGNYSGTVVIE